MTEAPYVTHPLGDSALTVSLAKTRSLTLLKKVQGAALTIREAGLEHLEDVVPGYTTVTVFYDARHTSYAELSPRILGLLRENARSTSPGFAAHTIAVRYDGADLQCVAHESGLTVVEVVGLHTGPTYTVDLLGFAPGFAYLSEIDIRLVLPRRRQPRVRVPAGSVAIAGRQTAVYPLATPGGWHLIGRTDAVLFDSTRDRPATLNPGDTVRFEALP
ncbi:MAG TPA: 5-oxoprolinase subunit PxpB [Gemmatimonadaceae bacterium]|nr:5-oxoprolinase subunit PxpB [Gemmatimonadaceae bacterium]